jgi:hypothetical protein
MIQVYMCCEGITDFEPLCVFMRRAAQSSEIVVIRKTRNDLRRETVLLSGRRGVHKHVTDIDRLAMSAKKAKCKHIAYHQDADGNYNAVYNSIKNKFLDCVDTYSCLAIVPKEMTESWLLADEQAYIATFGSKPEYLPKEPEEIWGKKDDPDSNYPKHVMERILGQYNKTPNRDIYEYIAEQSNIDTLKERCPQSFVRFYDDLQGFSVLREERQGGGEEW